MAIKPTDFPDWTDGDPSKAVEPGGSKKAQGWVVESPPFQYMNWLFYNIDQWLKWLDEQVSTVLNAADGVSADSTILVTTGNTSIGSNVITDMASVAGLTTGMAVSGSGIQAGSWITEINGDEITLSKTAQANGTGTSLTIGHRYATGGNVQLQLNELDAAISLLVASIIPAEDTISIQEGDVTSGSYNMTGLSDTSEILVGALITGPSIPAGTNVLEIVSGSAIRMSKQASSNETDAEYEFSNNYAVGGMIQDQINELDMALKMRPGVMINGHLNATAGFILDTWVAGVTILIDNSSFASDFTFPNPTKMAGKSFTIKDVTGYLDVNQLGCIPFGAENIEGVNGNYYLSSNYGSWTFYCDGTNYWVN